jgi:hypothetical protein
LLGRSCCTTRLPPCDLLHADRLVAVLGERAQQGRPGRFGLQVPAFPALGRPQGYGPLRAGRAHAGEGVAAGDQDLFDSAGVPGRRRAVYATG